MGDSLYFLDNLLSLSNSFLSLSLIVTPFVCIFRAGFGVILACENRHPSSHTTRAGSEEGRLFSQPRVICVVRFFVCVAGKVRSGVSGVTSKVRKWEERVQKHIFFS